MDTLELAPEFQDEVLGTLKKGPWTSAEDAILIAYVTKHGEGNWNSVQKHSGLFRCGKSCRLRWANHLRPNLKKGAFTTEEERMIIELHAKLGNKWARMAAQLPGRTDNEIKNYWNTRIKRLMRAGLPVYPSDMPSPSSRVQIQGGGGGGSSHFNIFDVASHAAGSDGCMSMSSGGAADSDCVPTDLVPSPTGSGNVNGLPSHPSALPQDYHGSVQTHNQLNLAAALHAGTACHSHVMRSSCSSTGITGPAAPGDMHHPSLSSVVTQAVNSPALRAAMQADSPMRRMKRARDAAAMAAVSASVVPNGGAGGPGSAGPASTILSFPQLSDESSKTVPPYLKARRTCGRNSMRMASFAGFTYDPDPHDTTVAGSHLQDAMASMAAASAQRFHLTGGGGSSHGHHHFSASRPTSGLLKMEPPSSQSAESADSAGTPHASSALTSPFTATSFSLSNHLLSSEADSFGSNSNSLASNNNSSLLEALLQEAQSMDGFGLSDQARMDLADQLLVLSSSSNNPGVEVGANAMMMSPHKSRWQEDSDPTTPLGGRAFSVFSEETSPNCGAGPWEESSTLQSPLVGIKTEDNGEVTPCQVYMTDEDMSTLLDFAREAAPVTEWYTPTSEGYSMGSNLVAQAQACAASLNDALGAAFNQDVGSAGLEHMAPSTVANHVWELGSCPWNNLSGACQLGDLIQDCRPTHHSMLAADQMHNDPCAIYNHANLDYCRQ